MTCPISQGCHDNKNVYLITRSQHMKITEAEAGLRETALK